MCVRNADGAASQLGYDVCLVCFEEYRTKERTLLNRAAQKTFDPDVETGSLAVWRCEAGDGASDTVQAQGGGDRGVDSD